MTEFFETHLASSERQPISFTEAKRQKELELAKKALNFHKHWVEVLNGDIARIESGMIPIKNGVREVPKALGDDLPPAG